MNFPLESAQIMFVDGPVMVIIGPGVTPEEIVTSLRRISRMAYSASRIQQEEKESCQDRQPPALLS